MSWEIAMRGTDINGHEIVVKLGTFGKGKSALRAWKIFREDVQVGYASTESDAEENFGRVLNGYTRNATTGQWER